MGTKLVKKVKKRMGDENWPVNSSGQEKVGGLGPGALDPSSKSDLEKESFWQMLLGLY